MRKEEFKFEGRNLEVIALETDGVWTVTVREDGHTVGRMEYRTTNETVSAAAHASNRVDLVQEMMRIARRDVEEDNVGLNPPPS